MKITLYKNGAAYYDKEIFVISGDPLEIDLETDVAQDKLYAVCTLKDRHLQLRVKEGKITIPGDMLISGELHITIHEVENGDSIRRWNTERVTIKSLDDKYEVIPELQVLKKAVTELYTLIKNNKNI